MIIPMTPNLARVVIKDVCSKGFGQYTASDLMKAASLILKEYDQLRKELLEANARIDQLMSAQPRSEFSEG